MLDAQPDSHRLTRLGPYVIHRVLGEGGMGIVYDAHDPATHQRVALKSLHSSLTRNDTARARFEAEMRILDTLVHPNIVRSLGSAWLDGRLVLVLEYLEGRTIRDILRAEGPIPAARSVPIARQIALALVFAHIRPQPVVHRDIKPENIMVLADGTAKVMDFGVAKVLKEMDAASMATKQVGTVRYMSPEQADAKAITTKTDCYALGLLLYEMLSGHVPFDGDSLMSLLRQHCESAPPPFRDALRNTIPRELEQLVFALLEKRPENRPDAATAEATLRRIASAPEPASRTMVAASSPFPVAVSQPIVVTPLPRSPQAGSVDPIRVMPDRGGARLDTVQLIERKSRSRRWPIVAAAVAVSAIAGGVVLALTLSASSAPPAKKSSRASASTHLAGEPHPVGDAAPSASGSILAAQRKPASVCTANHCAPFSPADPTNVDETILFAECNAVALKLSPNARFTGESFISALPSGHIDVTQPRAMITFTFTSPEANIMVIVKPDMLVGYASGGAAEREAVTARCPLALAITAARNAGLVVGLATQAQLYQQQDRAVWSLINRDGSDARIEGPACRVANIRKPDKP